MSNFETGTKNSKQDVVEINLVQLARYFYSHRVALIALTLIFPLIIGVWKTLIRSAVYRSEIHLLLDMQSDESQLRSTQSFFMNETEMTAKKFELVEKYFESKDFAKMLDDVLSGKESVDGVDPAGVHYLESMFQGLSADESKSDLLLGFVEFHINTEKFRIEMAARHKDPKVSAVTTNLVGFSLVEFNRRMLLRRINSVKGFLLSQTEKTKGELTQLERELVNLQAKLKVVSPDEMRNRVNYFQVEQYSKYVDLQREFSAADALVHETDKQLKGMKAQTASGEEVNTSYVDQMQKRLDVLRYQRAQLGDANGTSEMAQRLDADIRGLQSQMMKVVKKSSPVTVNLWVFIKKLETDLFEIEQKRIRLKTEMQAAEKAVNLWKQGFDNLPENLRLINEIKRRIDLTTGLFTTLKSKLQETEIREAAQLNDLIIISQAEIPREPYGMTLGRSIFLSFCIGLFFASLVLGLKFALVPTIRDVTDLERFQVPLLGEIPLYRPNYRGFLQFSESYPLLTKESPVGPESSALRLIRFKLERLLSLGDRRSLGEGKVLSIVGTNVSEGRTFFSVNLADLLSMANYKVLILSFDFRKRGIRDYFKGRTLKSEKVSLPHFQLSKMEVSDSLHFIESEPMIRNWSDDLESPGFREHFKKWKAEYDLIVIDTPPMKGSIEPLISAQYADAMILIVNQRTTLREDLEQQLKHLRDSLNVSIFGVVNAVYDELNFSLSKNKDTEQFDEAA